LFLFLCPLVLPGVGHRCLILTMPTHSSQRRSSHIIFCCFFHQVFSRPERARSLDELIRFSLSVLFLFNFFFLLRAPPQLLRPCLSPARLSSSLFIEWVSISSPFFPSFPLTCVFYLGLPDFVPFFLITRHLRNYAGSVPSSRMAMSLVYFFSSCPLLFSLLLSFFERRPPPPASCSTLSFPPPRFFCLLPVTPLFPISKVFGSRSNVFFPFFLVLNYFLFYCFQHFLWSPLKPLPARSPVSKDSPAFHHPFPFSSCFHLHPDLPLSWFHLAKVPPLCPFLAPFDGPFFSFAVFV